MNDVFYPKLSSIIDVDQLPAQLGFIKDGLSNLFDKLYFRDLQAERDQSGSLISYDLVVIAYKRLGVEIPGTGLELVLNPSHSTTAPVTEIPLSVTFQWEVRKYIQNFNLATFADGPSELFDLARTRFLLDGHNLVSIVAATLIGGTDPLTTFATHVNNQYSAGIPLPLSTNQAVAVGDIVEAIAANATKDLKAIVFDDYILDAQGVTETLENLGKFLEVILGEQPITRLRALLLPRIDARLALSAGVIFPRTALIPLDASGAPVTDENERFQVVFDAGELYFSTEKGIGFAEELELVAAPYTRAQIGTTGLTVGFTRAKLDLSRTTNIPEADADGRPSDFVGVFIERVEIGLPQFWRTTGSGNAKVIGKNLLIGTGGISGAIGLEPDGANNLLHVEIGQGGFAVSLNAFDITFKQNSIIHTNIAGELTIPGFTNTNDQPVKVGITATIDNDGFKITAVPTPPVELRIKNVLKIKVESLSIGRKNGKYFIAASGKLEFEDQGGVIGKFLPSAIEIKKILIWQDGAIEFEGGSLVLPRAVTVQIGPAKISVTAIHLGSHEGMHNNARRRYRYVGFDGGINVNPGGVDARGDGIKFYFTVDGGPLHVFLRIQSIAVNIVIPGNVNREDASVLISGYLSMKDPSGPTQQSGTEYQGGITFELPKLKMGGSAAMRLNPSKGAFLVDAQLELSTPILLGTTGLGIYGFRGLIGQKYVVDKSLALPVGSPRSPDTVEWWEYYKAKVAPDNKVGIWPAKFRQRDGFSIGAGASVATTADSGRTFSAKVFVLLSLPEVFLLQGQAAILSKRLGLDSPDDPPFSAFISVDRKSVQAGFGVHYNIPESGEIMKLNAEVGLGFFFGNASAWYVNVGQDEPPSKRVSARLLSIVDAYAYLMLGSGGIRAGAGASWELNKKFGPVGVELGAYFDTGGRISFKPVQIGAFIRVGGYARLRVFKFKFGLSVSASLSGEAPKPFIVSGSFTVSLNLPWPFKDIEVDIDITWRFRDGLNMDEVRLIEMPGSDPARQPAKALNIMSQEPFALAAYNSTGSALPGNWPAALNANVVPMDSFIDIEFTRGVRPNAGNATIQRLGQIVTGIVYSENVPPQRARHDQVTHEFHVNQVRVLYWDNDSWKPYEIFVAQTPLRDIANVDMATLTGAKIGFFQLTEPNKYTKLRILAQTPLSYTTQGMKGSVVVEDLGFPGGVLFCPQDLLVRKCANWREATFTGTVYKADTLYHHRGLTLKPVDREARVGIFPNVFGINNAVYMEWGGSLEIRFPEPVALVSLKLSSLATEVVIKYYTRARVDLASPPAPQPGLWNIGGQPAVAGAIDSYGTPVHTISRAWTELATEVEFNGGAQVPPVMVDRIVITPQGACGDPGYHWSNLAAWLIAQRAALQAQSSTAQFQAQQARSRCTTAQLCDAHCRANCTQCSNTILTQYCREADALEAAAAAINAQIGKLNDALAAIGNGSGPAVADTYCAVYLHEVCWLTKEHYDFNLTIPGQSQVNGASQNMVESLKKIIQPIWRPNTYFAIQVETQDRIVSPGGGPTYTQYYTFGFRTGGPVGHFHQTQAQYLDLVTKDRQDEYKLATLKHYIDYTRSYPNADGNIINAKPLYYREPRLLLFYRHAYVYAMYSDWDVYGKLSAARTKLEVVIKDPAEPAVNPAPKVVPAMWQRNDVARLEEDVMILNNLMLFGRNCILATGPIKRPGMHAEVPLKADGGLQPLKLYSVIMNANFNNVRNEVHRYVFQTSRYADFAEHIGSHILSDDPANPRKAVYRLDGVVTSGMRATAINMLAGMNDATQLDLKKKYAHLFDRLTDGALALRSADPGLGTVALEAAERLEFTIVTQGAAIVGILVRSPEPFNDPKIPEADLLAAIQVRLEPTSAPGTEVSNFTRVLSKDCAKIFITNTGMSIQPGMMRITFSYLEYDGTAYVQRATATAKFAVA